MSVASIARQFLAKDRRWFWAIGAVAALGLTAIYVVVPRDAFADTPKLVLASAKTTGANELTVTMTCPRGMTAVGVSAAVSGFEGVSINRMWPDGRNGYARASATQGVTEPWTLRAETVCVQGTVDIEYVSAVRTENKAVTGTSPSLAPYRTTACPAGKELIGLGWAVDPKARIAGVRASGGYGNGGAGTGYYPTGTGYYPTGTGYYPTGTGYYPTGTGYYPTGTGYYPTGTGYYPTGTGYYPTGTGYWPTGSLGPIGGFFRAVEVGSYAEADGPASWKTSSMAVCATPGHGTEVYQTYDIPRGNVYTKNGRIPSNKHVHASGFVFTTDSHGSGPLLRELSIGSDLTSGTITAIRPGSNQSSRWMVAYQLLATT